MTTELATFDETTFSLASLPEKLQAKILAASQTIKDSSTISINKIRIDAKSFIFPDGNEVQTFSGIIVASKHANIHYQGEYEEGKTNPPDCVAVLPGEQDSPNDRLIPHADVVARFGTTCNECPKLQWGSDKGGKGKGKECAEHVLLAIYVPSLGDDLYLLEAKKGNARIVDGYIAATVTKFQHTVAVNTQFSMGETKKWKQSFKAEGFANGDVVAALVKRFDEANNMLYARVIDAYRRGSVEVAVPSAELPANAPKRAARS